MLDIFNREPINLTTDQITLLKNTMSHNSFYYILVNHIQNHIPMCIVRMGDGEQLILKNYYENPEKTIEEITDAGWVERLGYTGATLKDAALLINLAIKNADYFAPNINGIIEPHYSLYPYATKHTQFVDNFFVNNFTDSQIKSILRLSKKILVINRNTELGEVLKDKYSNDEYQFDFIKLTNWTEIDDVVDLAARSDCEVIFVSGNKIIGPKLVQHNKIVIDLGNTIDRWVSV